MAILIILQLRGKVRAIDLANEFEVSVRTIYRDIDELSAAGIPVYGDGGPGGGISILDGFKTKLTGIEENEAKSLLMIGLPQQAKLLGLGDGARNIANKLLLSLSAEKREKAQTIASKFHFDFAPWYKSQNQPPFLFEVSNALLNDFEIEFVYESWKQSKKWHVFPLGLVFKANEYYLIANSKKATGVFKLANIHELNVFSAPAARPDFNLENFWNSHLNEFYEHLFLSDAELIVDQADFDALAQSPYIQIISQKKCEELGFATPVKIQLKYDLEKNLIKTILGAGFPIKLLTPKHLAESIRKEAIKIAELH